MSKFLSYEDRMIIAQRLQENASFGAIGKELGKDRTTISKEIKSIPMTRKAVVLDIRIILVNSVLHAKQKGFAEQAVHTNLLTNAACALNAPYIVLTL